MNITAAILDARPRLAELHCKSLAKIVADLVNANEPLLKAEAKGKVVSVSERGGPGTFTISVEPGAVE